MDGRSISREDERYVIARVVRRSRMFFTAPIAIIAVISLNLVWDVIRQNLGSHALSSWPLRFAVLDTSTTATALAIFVPLFMGRLQWARTLRPFVGFAIDDEGAQFSPSSQIWRLWIYNSGPGAAVIDHVAYYVSFADQPHGEGAEDWVSLSIVNDQLRSRNLADGVDYFMRLYARGAPFPVVQKYSDGMVLAWFHVKALSLIRILDIRLTYTDSLGDMHEKKLPVIQRLPSVTVKAIAAQGEPVAGNRL